MANVRAFYEPLADSWVLMGTQFWVAMVCGIVFAFPVVSLALDAAERPVFGRSPRIAEARLDTLFVHPLPIPLLLIGFVLSMAILAGNSLNPFLYFRF
jgi:glycerol uptake facilitator-like aquaporin